MDFQQSLAVNTPASRRRGRVAALTLVIVMLVGLTQAYIAWHKPAELALPTSWHDFTTGKTTHALADALDKRMPLRTDFIAVANGLRYRLLHESVADVVVGRDGWLFLSEEFRNDGPATQLFNTRIKLITETQQALQAQGVKLLIALVPDKSRVYSQYVMTGEYPAYHASRYADALRELRQNGVTVVDLLTALDAGRAGGATYYRTDSHWNQRGARIAADAIARVAFDGHPCDPATRFQTTATGPVVRRAGDLVRLMGLDHAFSWLGPVPDFEGPLVTKELPGGDSGGMGLFGDAGVPVVLTGTSFSMRANFHGALQQAMECRVLDSAQDGGGLLQSTTAYLTDDAFKQSKPKLLIWEIPERFLTLPLTKESTWLHDTGLDSGSHSLPVAKR
ncbi:MAG: hypothetical protein ABI114_16545 [Rhodanobacter sp.]